MAHMIPPVPKEYDAKSEEGIVFNALRDLPDDYYVFHSFSPTVVSEGIIYEREIDFVVANQKKGILCIDELCTYRQEGTDGADDIEIFYCDNAKGCRCGRRDNLCPQGAFCDKRINTGNMYESRIRCIKSDKEMNAEVLYEIMKNNITDYMNHTKEENIVSDTKSFPY